VDKLWDWLLEAQREQRALQEKEEQATA
jgi:hypothetical protein